MSFTGIRPRTVCQHPKCKLPYREHLGIHCPKGGGTFKRYVRGNGSALRASFSLNPNEVLALAAVLHVAVGHGDTRSLARTHGLELRRLAKRAETARRRIAAQQKAKSAAATPANGDSHSPSTGVVAADNARAAE